MLLKYAQRVDNWKMNLAIVTPFPATIIFDYLGKRLIEGRESRQGLTWTRSLDDGVLSVTARDEHLEVSSETREPTAQDVARITRLLGQDQNWSPPPVFLADPILRPLVARAQGFRPLGCWEPFELILRTIVGQQVSVAAAGTLMRRLGERAGGWSATQVAEADLSAMGMPGSRILTLQSLARTVAEGRIDLNAPWEAVRASLEELPGFGPWTLGYLGIRLGRDLDAFPSSDLGLLRGTGCRTSKELEKRAESWRPYRGWAASYLWSL